MKAFFKSVFGSCLGTLLALSFLAIVAVIMISTSQDKKVKNGSVLHLDFKHLVPELTDNVNSQQTFQSSQAAAPGLRRIKKLIEHAADDPKIKGILIEPNPSSTSFTKSLEILKTLEKFKASDKFIYAYSDYYNQNGYVLSSIADSIFLNPNGGIQIKGFGMMSMYYKELMDRLGVKMNIFYAGNYKSGSEPYRLNEMSSNNREQTDDYLQHLESILRTTIKANRGIQEEDLEAYMARNEIFDSAAAQKENLSDRLVYWDECLQSLASVQNVSVQDLNFIPLVEYHEKTKLKKAKGAHKIAVVYAEGNIYFGSGANGDVYSSNFNSILREIQAKQEVKAVVLRVNSPGGDGHASDNIHREIRQVQAKGIPVVTSMGTYAASGGYYIAAPSDYIYAEPSTLTGSIGVYSMFPEFNELVEEKIGLHFDSVKTSPHAISFDPFFGISLSEKEQLQATTLRVYDQFLSVVSEGRELSIPEVKKIAQGRIWNASEAVENGLVDEIGSLNEAITKAAALAEIDSYQILEFPKIEKSLIEDLASQAFSQTHSDPMLNLILEEKNKLQPLLQFLQAKRPMTRLPIEFSVNR